MLAYRHAFHAGNHADVLKHVVLLQLLRHLMLKDKGLRIVDTHAGAGVYELDSAQALKKGEYLQGIARLWPLPETPPPVDDYLRQVRALNPDGALRRYPGSPQIIRQLLRPQDQLRLFELHPTDQRVLAEQFKGVAGVELCLADGFAALKSQLPPPTRRALVLLDPSYEGHADYQRVLHALADGLRRFAQGVYMVWFPVVSKPGAEAMIQGLKQLAPAGWLHARLLLQQPDALGFGLSGSGLLVLNPPHTLHAQLLDLLPWLVRQLGQYPGAHHLLEQRPA
jgi:23S rRNA (adenine2030-N6)-methyltransferase